jgi:hypothetical protein
MIGCQVQQIAFLVQTNKATGRPASEIASFLMPRDFHWLNTVVATLQSPHAASWQAIMRASLLAAPVPSVAIACLSV